MKKVADVLWFVVVSASLALLLAAPVMWLWNGLFVDLPAITYGKSLGLCLLARFLFGTGFSFIFLGKSE